MPRRSLLALPRAAATVAALSAVALIFMAAPPAAAADAAPAWPDATTTGVPAGTVLEPSGPLRVTTPGAVVDGLDIAGQLLIAADDVTVRRTRVRSSGVAEPLRIEKGFTGVVVEDTEVVGTDLQCLIGVVTGPATLRRVDVHGCVDGLRLSHGVVVVDSWVHDLRVGPGTHNDAVQATHGIGMRLVGNRIEGRLREQTSAILLKADRGSIRDVLVQGNLLSGGGFTVYTESNPDTTFGPPTHVRFLDNVFVPATWRYGFASLEHGEGLTWLGNTTADGAPIGTDQGSRSEAEAAPRTGTRPQPGEAAPPLEIIAGNSPAEAALEVARRRFANAAGSGRHAAHAVLVRDDAFPEALAAGPLLRDGPLLVTDRRRLDGDVAAELRRILPAGGTVYVLGGSAAISEEVVGAVEAVGLHPIRLAGATRVETALAVATRSRTWQQGAGEVLVARADATEPTQEWADSVAAGPHAAAAGTPVVLTPSAGLHPAVAAWLADAAPARSVLLGGRSALSAAVEAAVPAPLRVAGADRAGTARAIADQLRRRPPGERRTFVVVDAGAEDGWAYGLLAAGLAADLGADLALSSGQAVPPATAELVGRCGPAPAVLVFGGQSAADPRRSVPRTC